MNRLTATERVQVIRCLVEGCSIRSTVRITGVSKKAVTRLLVDMGRTCREFHNEAVRGLKTLHLQADEQWAFVGAKQKQVERGANGYGDAWLWVGIDSDTKLVVSWIVGQRDEDTAYAFAHDLAGRINSRTQLTTDGLAAYLKPIRDAFGTEIDYAQLIKIYGNAGVEDRSPEARYSPASCTGTKLQTRIGFPNPLHISTSYIERQNLTNRMSIRRFTRLTNGFSKKIENHEAAVSLHYAYYNFCRVHQTLRVTPAMEAGLTDHAWELDELVALLEKIEGARIEAGALKRGHYRAKAG